MSAVRDWINTLWRASYKGVPFFFEKSEETGGRGLVKHQFPHRDDPFIEDLGEDLRIFEGTAYVHGDDADAQGSRLSEMFASNGPGTLVLPMRGPVLVRCEQFKREDERGKFGYVGYSIKLIRDGAATALISVAFGGQQAFQSADRLAAALAAIFPHVITIGDDVPDHVTDAAIGGLESGVGSLEAVRVSASVDPATSAQVRDADAALFDLLPGLTTDNAAALASTLIANTRALADGISNPAQAQAAMADLADAHVTALAPAYLAPSDQPANVNAVEADRLIRLAALTAWAEALLRRTYKSRPDGVTARAEAAFRFGRELDQCPGADYAPLYVAISDLRGRVVDFLSRLIADLAPVIEVTANRSMPSLYWAYRLYQDPLRSAELVDRNGVKHPSFMPFTFSALAPARSA